jgi:ABC-type nitrate/sulfonate/bicarbonate transport system substrate-binding protein
MPASTRSALPLLRVNVFPGGFNWPIFVAIENGFFSSQGITVELQATSGSIAQMTDFAAEQCDVVMTAFDNIVAYAEGEGEAPIGPQPEFFTFLGSDNSFLSLVSLPDVSSIAELRGRSVSVDAATTGYAFVLFDILNEAGLGSRDYEVAKVGGMAQRFSDLCGKGRAATMLSSPYDILAEQQGLRVLARVENPYQGNVGAARRDWARKNENSIIAYTRAYIGALDWLHDRANRVEACDILERNVTGMTRELAIASYARMLVQNGGFSRNGRIDDAGARTVLNLRLRYGPSGRALADPGKYADIRYWERARSLNGGQLR